MLVLSVCHTVVLETLPSGKTAYQAESPDEEALVSAAAKMGYRFAGGCNTCMRKGGRAALSVLLIMGLMMIQGLTG